MRDVFGPFILLSQLGRGGMAETFVASRRGTAEDLASRVCVKRILNGSATDADWIKQFRREAKILAALDHPNIVRLFAFDQTDDREGRWWMSLELVDGLDLRALMNAQKKEERRLPLDVILFITRELAKALGHAHGRKLADGAAGTVVHRDVSPTNVLVRKDGAVKLTDFGIAKATDDGRTRTGMFSGKVGYMSPEQCSELPTDHRTDLFSLGVIVFEMLAGTRPFDDVTERVTKVNTVKDQRKDLRALAPETPDALLRIVASLTANRPYARFASAEALSDALGELPIDHKAPANLARLVSEATTLAGKGGVQ